MTFTTKHPYRTILLLAVTLSAVLSLVPFARTAEPGELLLDQEFSEDFDTAKTQYHQTVNCFFNLALQKHMEFFNRQYQKSTQAKLPTQAPAHIADCQHLEDSKIQGYYQQVLEEMLRDLVLEPDKKVAAQSALQDSVRACLPDEEDAAGNCRAVCNLDLRNGKLLRPSADLDYFEKEKKETLSPTYAVAVVSNCYYLVWEQHLNARIQQSYQIPQTTSSSSQESVFQERSQRSQQMQDEMARSDKALDLALAALEEMIQTYPLHVQYQAIIAHSQKLRDQFRGIRVAIDQLQYKLPNQSTQTCP